MECKNNGTMQIGLALVLFVFANEAGIICDLIAKTVYAFLAESPISASIPRPDITEIVFRASLFDLILSPSTFLQAVKSLMNISSAVSLDDPFKYAQLFLEILSLANLWLSWRYSTYSVSLILCLALPIAYAQAEMLLLKYLLQVIAAALSNALSTPVM